MKLRMHHIELCVSDPNPVTKLLCNQLGLRFVGYRETVQCLQLIFKMEKATFVVTSRKDVNLAGNVKNNNNNYPDILFESGTLAESNLVLLPRDSSEAWTLFCCDDRISGPSDISCIDDVDNGSVHRKKHVDSVFNVAIQVENVRESVKIIRNMSDDLVLQDVKRAYDSDSNLGYVDYAVIKSCCGNVVHTLVQKNEYQGWFLPGFQAVHVANFPATSDFMNMTHFDHFTLACRVGESNEIMDWYERAFDMKRFITNRYIINFEIFSNLLKSVLNAVL